MVNRIGVVGLFLLIMIMGMSPGISAENLSSPSLTIAIPKDASYLETLAGREVCRYIYLRTGVLASIVTDDPTDAKTPTIVIARKDRDFLANLGNDLQPQQYLLKTNQNESHKQLWIIGGDDAGTLYGAYRFAEHLGVRFYLHGDVIPDERIDLQLPNLDETGKPLFETRGIQPFHDFPEGPDWWNEEEYKAIFSQLPKLRMNFFGLHTYPEERPCAEPTVWIGLPQDIATEGDVSFSYPSSYQNTLRGNWGYVAKLTRDYSFGSADLFEFDAYGPDVMGNSLPFPSKAIDSNGVFDRTGTMFRDVFTFARQLGIKTCVGTETPLIIPKVLQERLKALGKDPADPAVVRELYEGMFKRIMETYPIDYYWFWTPEGWIWEGVSEEQVNATKNDLLTAIQAAQNVGAPFTLATCGWVLGPESNRSLFDRVLPKTMPMSCINREVGKAPVQPDFATIQDRSLWAIPWMEDDPALLNSRLGVGRMRADAVDAYRYGCDGLLGIHWRTRILSPNVSALAAAAWKQENWGIDESFYQTVKAEGPKNGQNVAWPEKPVLGTEEDFLYQTARENVSAYHFAVPNDQYTVVLKFASAPQSRSFSVIIEGNSVLIPKVSLGQEAGESRTAIEYSFEKIPVNDGWMDIEFSPMVGIPCICALSVTSGSYAKRVNCGGPAYQDYQADSPSAPVKPRHLASGDFYLDWAKQNFGDNVAKPIAAVFEKLDGKFPCPSDWIDGPGGLKPDDRPWEEARKDYAFLKELEKQQTRIKTPGNRERFDYWLRNFQFMQSLAQTRCIWGEMNKIIEDKVKKETDALTKKTLIYTEVLPLANRMIEAFSDAYKILLPSISNSGEMGTICNLEQHVMDLMITRPQKQLSELAGESIVFGSAMSQDYEGPARLIVPTIRTTITKNEPFFLKVILLDRYEPREADLYWRAMGEGEFQSIPLTHLRRGVYKVEFPAQATADSSIEYYIQVRSGSGKTLHFPTTAPQLNQTVVVMP